MNLISLCGLLGIKRGIKLWLLDFRCRRDKEFALGWAQTLEEASLVDPDPVYRSLCKMFYEQIRGYWRNQP